jgi:hypothetical protein
VGAHLGFYLFVKRCKLHFVTESSEFISLTFFLEDVKSAVLKGSARRSLRCVFSRCVFRFGLVVACVM